MAFTPVTWHTVHHHVPQCPSNAHLTTSHTENRRKALESTSYVTSSDPSLKPQGEFKRCGPQAQAMCPWVQKHTR